MFKLNPQSLTKFSIKKFPIKHSILDLSKIKANQIKLETIKFSLTHVISSLKNILEFQANEKGVHLTFDIDNNIPIYLMGDPMRLTQILINLGNNALKFTDKGGKVIIYITLDGEDKRSNEVLLHFSVQDNGIGISPEQQNQLFAPFQADSSTTRHYGGTGLGLTICKKLTELMQGEIWLDSQLNIGSTFHFTIIFGIQTRKKDLITNIQGYKILLVEDDKVSQDLMTIILKQFGGDVEQAENGQKALDKLATNHYDCILMDCNMPVMDGYTAIKKIRQQDKFSQLPIIAITANMINKEKESILALGANEYITKPIDIELLFQLIIKWIKPIENRVQRTLLAKPSSVQKTKVPLLIFPEILGINTHAGLILSRNNKELYRRLLESFYNNYKNSFETILSSNNYVQIKAFAHKVKGAATTISATELCHKAQKLEFTCYTLIETSMDDDYELSVLINDFIFEFNQVIKGLSDYLKYNHDP